MSTAYFENDREPEIPTRRALRWVLELLRPHFGGLAFCVGLIALSTALIVSKGLLIKAAIDDGLAKKDWQTVLIVVGLYLASQGALMAVTYAQRLKLERLGQNVISDLRVTLYDKIIGLAVSYFSRNPSGRLMARVESDTESLRTLLSFAVTVIVGDILLVGAMVGTMWVVSPRLTLVALAYIPILGGLAYIYTRITNPLFLDARKRMADVTATITEFLQGISITQIFGREAYARARMAEANRAKFILDRYIHIANTTFFNLVFLMEAAIITSLLLWGGAWASQGLVTIGSLVMFIQYTRKMFEPLYRFSEQSHVAQRAIAGAKRIMGIMDSQEVILDPATPLGFTQFEKCIRLENVWLSYSNDERYALRDVSLEIPRGKRIALVGVTGGGKSTIINLLLRFLDPQKGRVTIDGHDIRTMTKKELRALYGLVLQDIYLFPGDVVSNISLDSPAISLEEIKRAAEIVGAGEFIGRLDGGYRAMISERGANLSRGERQLLSFARALAHNPQVLILDEATSSVDPETERCIQNALSRLLEDRTSVIVAHRLSTILSCDEIIVVKDGQIIERGTHQELERAEGYYHTLFRLQFAESDSPTVATEEVTNAG